MMEHRSVVFLKHSIVQQGQLEILIYKFVKNAQIFAKHA